MNISWIEDGQLAASSIPVGLKDMQSLHEQGIRAILTLTERPLTTQKEISDETFRQMGIEYRHIPVDDFGPPDVEQAYEGAAFIDAMKTQGRSVFVHCAAGQGRTGTMLHAYFLTKGLGLEAAKQLVQSRRPASQWIGLSESQKAFLERFAALCKADGA